MKKIAALLLICLLLPLAALAQTLGAGSQRVFDDAGLMSQSDIAKLESQIAQMRSRYDMDIVVLTSDHATDGQSLAFADDFYEKGGFGVGADHSGFLFFIDMKNRVPTISTEGLMIRYITDNRLEYLLDRAYVYLVDSDYGAAVAEVLKWLDSYLQGGIRPDQYNQDEYGNIDYYRTSVKSLTGGEIAIALAAGLLAGLGLFLGIRWRYGLKGSTYKYDVHGNSAVNITGATDVYLRTQVTKTPKASSGSGGSGGGRSSTHHSSSGRVHGGGSGRRF